MKKARMGTDAFNRIISATKGFQSKYSGNKLHQYIKLEFRANLDEAVAVAVDGYKMSVEHCVCKSNEDFAVYVKSNIKLPSHTEVDIELDEVSHEAVFRCDGFIFGYHQPQGEFLAWEKVLPDSEPSFKIGFNGDYLLSALQAAKVSVGGTYKNPIVLEFRSSTEPVIIRTNKNDIKLVLPVKMKN